LHKTREKKKTKRKSLGKIIAGFDQIKKKQFEGLFYEI
jgi:homoserine trans-succinylase